MRLFALSFTPLFGTELYQLAAVEAESVDARLAQLWSIAILSSCRYVLSSLPCGEHRIEGFTPAIQMDQDKIRYILFYLQHVSAIYRYSVSLSVEDDRSYPHTSGFFVAGASTLSVLSFGALAHDSPVVQFAVLSSASSEAFALFRTPATIREACLLAGLGLPFFTGLSSVGSGGVGS